MDDSIKLLRRYLENKIECYTLYIKSGEAVDAQFYHGALSAYKNVLDRITKLTESDSEKREKDNIYDIIEGMFNIRF